ncbi:hypothetical protein NDU88_007369 [Pleurodeles waltl]|uniref:Uncharacterized protein n=1 Tax=Pleurodeles waltl TaxID=8319 RepID=A0AAV7U118_PLEWA|nr:hypothetical protein NDU88_007369 [Pleurodeles waltl]
MRTRRTGGVRPIRGAGGVTYPNVAGQDSAAIEDQGDLQVGQSTPPAQQPFLDDPPVGDELLPHMHDDTFQKLLDYIESPPDLARDGSLAGSPDEPPPTENAPSAKHSCGC